MCNFFLLNCLQKVREMLKNKVISLLPSALGQGSMRKFQKPIRPVYKEHTTQGGLSGSDTHTELRIFLYEKGNPVSPASTPKSSLHSACHCVIHHWLANNYQKILKIRLNSLEASQMYTLQRQSKRTTCSQIS